MLVISMRMLKQEEFLIVVPLGLLFKARQDVVNLIDDVFNSAAAENNVCKDKDARQAPAAIAKKH